MRMLLSRLSGALVMCATGAAHAQEKFHVVMPVALDPRAPLTTETARHECGVDMLLGNFVFQTVGNAFPGASRSQEADDPGREKVLKVTILNAHAEGRTAWSGPKSITVRVEVWQHAKVIGSTILRRQAYGGALGTMGMVGTCQTLEGIAMRLGQDVTEWLPKTIVPGTPLPVAPALPPQKKAAKK